MTLSPCTGVCSLDAPSGWCVGCGRTAQEIGRWGNYSPEEREQVWDLLSSRLGQVGSRMLRIPWSPNDAWREATARLRAGTWTLGGPAAQASLELQPEGSVTLTDGRGTHRASSGATIELRSVRQLHAFTPVRRGAGAETSPERVAWAVRAHQGRGPAAGLTELASSEGRASFDLAVPARSVRVTVETKHQQTVRTLRGFEGASFEQTVTTLQSLTVAGAGWWVFESPMVRLWLPMGAGPDAAAQGWTVEWSAFGQGTDEWEGPSTYILGAEWSERTSKRHA